MIATATVFEKDVRLWATVTVRTQVTSSAQIGTILTDWLSKLVTPGHPIVWEIKPIETRAMTAAPSEALRAVVGVAQGDDLIESETPQSFPSVAGRILAVEMACQCGDVIYADSLRTGTIVCRACGQAFAPTS
ncbi:MAG TPA: hypothetical protein VLK30_03270 [Candidatus Limnocylindrales bacterium]|nr:hypothetical protein [Candidatus Limnocylindrales bacterium]